jgi:predicted O-methyltransferase YrrM
VTAADVVSWPDDYLPDMAGIEGTERARRSVRDGYARGWGLEFGGLAQRVAADPLYREAAALAAGRSLVTEARRMDLFLLIRFFLPRLPPGNLVEFGAYKGGNAMFMARVAREVLPGALIYALDTFTGMPPTDKSVDAHSAGDFGDVDLPDLRHAIANSGLTNLRLVVGRFEETAPALMTTAAPFALAHIDCDIYSAVAYAYETVRSAMIPGGYLVFDDATSGSCLGATEAVESLVIRRDGLNSEQISPHFVFRAPGR